MNKLSFWKSECFAGDFFVVPTWVPGAGLGLFVAAVLIPGLPQPGAGVAVTAVQFVVLVVTPLELMTMHIMWPQVMLPATLLPVGFGLLAS